MKSTSLALSLLDWSTGPFCSSCSNCSDSDWGQKERAQRNHPTHTPLGRPTLKAQFHAASSGEGARPQVWEARQGFLCLGRRSTGGQRRTLPPSSAAHLETRLLCTHPLEDCVQPGRQVRGCRASDPALDSRADLKAPDPLRSGLSPSPFAV